MARSVGSKNKVAETEVTDTALRVMIPGAAVQHVNESEGATLTIQEPVIGVLNESIRMPSIEDIQSVDLSDKSRFDILPSQVSKTINPKQLAAELSAEITIVDAHGIGLYGRTNAYVNTKGKTYGEVLQAFRDMGI